MDNENKSQKYINHCYMLDNEREFLTSEDEKNNHFADNLKDVIWDGKNHKRALRLSKSGIIEYIHIPGVCGFFKKRSPKW